MFKASLWFVTAVAATTEDANVADLVNTTVNTTAVSTTEPVVSETETEDEPVVSERFLAKRHNNHRGHNHNHRGNRLRNRFGRHHGGYGRYGRHGYGGYGGYGDWGYNSFFRGGVMLGGMERYFGGFPSATINNWGVTAPIYERCRGIHSSLFINGLSSLPRPFVDCLRGGVVVRQLNNNHNHPNRRWNHKLHRVMKRLRRRINHGMMPMWWAPQQFGTYASYGNYECEEGSPCCLESFESYTADLFTTCRQTRQITMIPL